MMDPWEMARVPRWLVIVLALIAGGTVTVVLIDSDDDGSPDTVKVEVKKASYDGADRDRKPDDGVLKAPEKAVESAGDRVEEGVSRKDPFGGVPAVQEAISHNKATTQALPLGGAFQSVPGCKTRLLPGDSSSRNGVRPVWLQWHYAVIRNKPGFSDLDLLFNIFADTGRDASSSFGLDAEGNCYYMVPIERKPWTAVATNPFIISVEVIAMGDEQEYCPGPCLAQARRIAQWVKQQTGIPIRRGSTSSSNLCVPGSSGQMTHADHGICAGGHVDIKPFSIDAFVRKLAAPSTVLTSLELKIVHGVRHPKGTGHSRRYWCGRLNAQIAWLVRSPKVARHDRRLAILRRVRRESCT